ncbi:P-loop containing nucleoside triphosphate hydrolase protein [Apiospora marii]|uniref:P-loop containing nucleoside triphosphate hydrolase protein n=1 Tax=Apiospora marii TaxID=335849 RepID=A0ABR1QZU3_9PEZI
MSAEVSDKASASPHGGRDTPPGSSPSIATASRSTAPKARIGYRTEYRHMTTGELIKEETSDTPQTDTSGANDADDTPDLIFDIVTTYSYIPGPSNKDNKVAIQSTIEPTHAMKLYSPAIINALRSVVQYYPYQDLNGDITIDWPYCILVHHYDELQEYSNTRAAMLPEKLCMRDRFVGEHMKALIKYLDETVMEGVRAEMERNKRGYYTFEHAWVGYRPGRTVLFHYKSRENWVPGVIQSVSGGTLRTPPVQWALSHWKLEYDGQYLTRKSITVDTDRFDGEASYGAVGIKFVDTSATEEDIDPIVQDLIEWGRIYCQLLVNQCMHHEGRSPRFPYQQIEGLVMADAKTAVSIEPPLGIMADRDLRKGGWRCFCAVCQSTQADGSEKGFQALFEDYHKIGSQSWEQGLLTDHKYLLCPSELMVFVFKTRTWEQVHVKNLRNPEFDKTMVDSLVMDDRKKQTLTSLAKSFARKNKANDTISKPMWSADFVVGKGTGLTFLLHGKPGVGKTLTAECIAAFTERPLMILTSSDIGTNATDVEYNLSKHFKNAKNWGAVLLIDEADVFMERRTTDDLTRNSLVAGFLRALEYYEGILFLTTNRVGSFDDAFISRVHVQLYYPEFTNEQRQKVWQTFIDKLENDRKDYIRLHAKAEEYIEEINKGDLDWNGREIRNAFQTAVSLAEYDGEKDREGTILVTDRHLRAVVELSKDFKDYLQELHSADEDKRAQGRRTERLGSFKKPKN